MDLGAPELVIILVIVALLFGANKLPGLARSMGSAVSEFRKGQAEGAVDHAKAIDARPPADGSAGDDPTASRPADDTAAPRSNDG